MKIGVLTSSRADFGIYQPLLNEISKDPTIYLTIIAFGMHLLEIYGNTIYEIIEKDYGKIDKIDTNLESDDVHSIAKSYAKTTAKFADYWHNKKFDWVFCLGDRFEMSAAVQAGIPYGVRFAHIHGGETTRGAIDDIYRHQITLASKLHFTSTKEYAERVVSILGSEENVFCVGALSLDELESFEFKNEKQLRAEYNIPPGDYILTTFHPETVEYNKNLEYISELEQALIELTKSSAIVITMPNADTMGSLYRKLFMDFKKRDPSKIVLVDSFGKRDYFSAMKYAKILLGNSSSGIIEAASFGKYVVNAGDRQKGRVQSNNVLNCVFRKEDILKTVELALSYQNYKGINYYKGLNTAKMIVTKLKSIS